MNTVLKNKWMNVLNLLVLFSASSWCVEPKLILPPDMPKYTLEHSQVSRMSYEGKIRVSQKEDGSYQIYTLPGVETPISVPLFVYDDPGFEAETILYSAEIKSDKIDLKAYIEMLCTFPDGKTYFSRAVSQSLSGPTTWEKQETSFFLKSGQRPTRITVGVRFEEPGYLLIRNVELKKADNSIRSSLYFYQFVMPRMLGLIYGCWGAAIGIIGGTMIPRGRFKKLVLTLIASMGLFSIAILILGITLQMSTGLASNVINQYYISAGVGIILSAVFIPMVLKQYQAVELRKMQAKDLG